MVRGDTHFCCSVILKPPTEQPQPHWSGCAYQSASDDRTRSAAGNKGLRPSSMAEGNFLSGLNKKNGLITACFPHSREHAAYKVSKWQRSSSWLGFPWNMNPWHTDLYSVQLRGVQTFCSFPTSGVIYPRPHYAHSGTLNCAWTPSGDCSQQLSVNSILIKERETNKPIPPKKTPRGRGGKQVMEDSLLLKCWRLLYWARLDTRRHREGWIQRDRLHCQLRRGVAQPSFHTWAHPEPTSLLTGRILTPAGSSVEKEMGWNRH